MIMQFRPFVLALSVASAFVAANAGAENVKVIDAFSGSMAPINTSIQKSYPMFADMSSQQKWMKRPAKS